MLNSSFFRILSALIVWCGMGQAALCALPYACVVMNPRTGHVLHEVNGNQEIPPASLTKLMTLRLAFQALERGTLHWGQPLVISDRAAAQEPSKLGLKAGSKITVKQAIFSLIVKSANDMAVVVAEALGGTESRFAQQMNREAQRLGMRSTRFFNASGLPHPLQKTTARDMAILSATMRRHFPQYYNYFKMKVFQFRTNNYTNHNKLLGRVAGVDGLKTGYIRSAGFHLAASATRGTQQLIVVVLGGPTGSWRDTHVTHLINLACNAPTLLPLLTIKLGPTGKGLRLIIPSKLKRRKALLKNQKRAIRKTSIEHILKKNSSPRHL